MKKMQKTISESNNFYFDSKVVSRNILTDWVQSIRNILGLELKAYTNIVNVTVKELQTRVPYKLKWFRHDIEELTNGAFLISIYGEKND